MKITIEFDSENPEDMERHDEMMKASKYRSVIDRVSNEIFRPAREHGYSDRNVERLMVECGDKADELVGELERLYCEILSEYGIDD